MAKPKFTLKDLLEAGVHFGHHARRWNPKMRRYIFGVRNKVHIINLEKTVPLMDDALTFLTNTAARGGKILFVGTKTQARDKIRETAERCGQYYVNNRWLGGMITNWNTISKSIARLKELEVLLADPEQRELRSKKELLFLQREMDKLELTIGGIKDMNGQPDAMFIIDVNRDDIAVAEANKLGIPVLGVLDTNSNPDGIDYPIPGNDDAIRAIDLYCDLAARSILKGLEQQLAASGSDIGEQTEVKEDLSKATEKGSKTTGEDNSAPENVSEPPQKAASK